MWEVGRTPKKISVPQSPNLPEYPLHPERLYNLMMFALAAWRWPGSGI